VSISEWHWSIRGISLGGVDRSKIGLGFHIEVKVQSLTSLDLLFH